jgi:hypothetical protein
MGEVFYLFRVRPQEVTHAACETSAYLLHGGTVHYDLVVSRIFFLFPHSFPLLVGPRGMGPRFIFSIPVQGASSDSDQ